MGRVRRVTAVALGAALLGLGVSALVGAHVRTVIATATLADTAARPGNAPAATSVPVAPVADAGASVTARPSSTSDGTRARSHAAARHRRGRGAGTAAPVASEGLLDRLERGIGKLGDRRYQIEASALSLALANLATLGGAVRVAPEIRDGKAQGFRLVWVAPDGPIAKLGLRTGDVLVSINGLDLRTPDQVLDAYGKLRVARRLVLGFVRDGDRLANEYAIR